MYSATDTYEIALDAEGVNNCQIMYDGYPVDPAAQGKLDYSKKLAFQNQEFNVYGTGEFLKKSKISKN